MEKILSTISQVLVIGFILLVFWAVWTFISKLKKKNNSVEIKNVKSKWEKDNMEKKEDYLTQEDIEKELEKLR